MKKHGLSKRILLTRGDLFDAVEDRFRGRFDVVASNPPYVEEPYREKLQREVSEHEPPAALFAGSDGLDFIRRLVSNAAPWLKSGGRILFEIGRSQSAAVGQTARACGLCRARVRKGLRRYRPRCLREEEMKKFVIEGGHKLNGKIRVSGSKNAALPILAATLMTEDECRISNVPDLSDIRVMCELLGELGVETEFSDGVILTKPVDNTGYEATWEIVKKMRASVCVLGPLLAARSRAKVSYPGGCNIGTRPIDLHLKGLRELGTNFDIEHGYIHGESRRLRGAKMYLGGHFGSSVLATANVMSAAVLADGETVISHAAAEPEVVALAEFLNAMGAKISGAGSSRIVVEGVSELHGAEYRVIPDRIETLTHVMAAGITRGRLRLLGAEPDHLSAVTDKLGGIGVQVDRIEDGLEAYATGDIKPADITTLPYPGFPTDGQAQMMALLATANGTSFITERVFPDRFMHVAELNRLGADIRRAGPTAVVNGVDKLSGAQIMAADLRAGAGLVLAALVAEGVTEIHRVYHIDRGYESIEEKLCSVGAQIERTEAEAP
ncbi:MAG: UDP-N-acetylglucosamine 1-carboxyvinyltransferase [Planctomycetota bacterium]|nr:UDP-N-acetylglucosamine 1-carboxyvinyltransferase [Planctomycetota bacterium]